MKQSLSVVLVYFLICGNVMAQSAKNKEPHYITVNIDIPQLNKKRDLQIYLPADYYHTTKRYPVIYMQDAQNIYENDGAKKDSWAVDSLLKTQPANKQAIIAGINHGGNDRISEYSPYKSRYGNGDGVAYTEFMVKTLKPYIDAHYRTKTDAKHTAIAGSSMGGLIALYAIIKYPEVFGTAGIFSPALWINPEIDKFVSDAKIPDGTRFFFACGDQEGNEADYVNKMDLLLHSKNVSMKNAPAPLILIGEKHNEHQWRNEFPVFYEWFIDTL